MNCKHITAALCLAALALAACKKDKDVSFPDLGGSLSFKAPYVVGAGDVLTLEPYGVYHPDGGNVGYVWYSSLDIAVRDTTRYENDPLSVKGTFTYVVPDQLETFYINCIAFAKGYSSSYCSRQVTVVGPSSISYDGEVLPVEDDILDEDGVQYNVADAGGGLSWLMSNLMNPSSGRSFEDCQAADYSIGRFYTAAEAATACPSGWRLPTLEEWKGLCGGAFEGAAGSLMGDAMLNGDILWAYSKDVRITNSTRLSALPSGYATISESGDYVFSGRLNYAAFWCSDSTTEGDTYVYINRNSPDVYVGYATPDRFALTVRCVKEN